MGSIKKELASQFRSLSVALTISMSVVFSIFAGAITGYYLDAWLFDGQSHWFTIICLFLGIAGAAKNFLILTKRFTKEPGEKKGKDQPGAHTSGRQDDV
ncbi:MAG: AtpZ/AtpI family protein [Deltaproteobacteria bacterium]|nr:AtpZ/AtpI family protein [Deltaproteobacteria bacterium]MDL1960588.1 AtpZ/AtpI family protein [Deltaproteobacteria bacterium]